MTPIFLGIVDAPDRSVLGANERALGRRLAIRLVFVSGRESQETLGLRSPERGQGFIRAVGLPRVGQPG